MDITAYQTFLRKNARRITKGNPAMSDDLVQMTNVKVLSIGIPHNCNNPYNWLATIMRTVYIDWRRKEMRAAAKHENAPIMSVSFDLNDAIDAHRLMNQMSTTHQESLIDDLLGYGTRELSERDNRPEGTYKTRLMRARLKAQEYFS